jgi:hypothetical protein
METIHYLQQDLFEWRHFFVLGIDQKIVLNGTVFFYFEHRFPRRTFNRLIKQAHWGYARLRLLLKICLVAKRMVRTTINLVGTLHVVQYVHHKRGGMLRTGYRLKEQEMTM